MNTVLDYELAATIFMVSRLIDFVRANLLFTSQSVLMLQLLQLRKSSLRTYLEEVFGLLLQGDNQFQ
jgi:hypothetical protein